MQNLVGKTHTFEDGDKLEVIQVKDRGEYFLVTYLAYTGPGIPRKLIMEAHEFMQQFGHLFDS
jgi:hypothetical protein